MLIYTNDCAFLFFFFFLNPRTSVRGHPKEDIFDAHPLSPPSPHVPPPSPLLLSSPLLSSPLLSSFTPCSPFTPCTPFTPCSSCTLKKIPCNLQGIFSIVWFALCL